jgi:hypothetical protein
MTPTRTTTDDRSGLLPTDPFDQAMAALTGLPDGAHTAPHVVQATDFYGHTTQFILQTFRWAEGDTVSVTQVNAAGHARYILPPKVVAAIQRQRDAVATAVKRRHGRRLAEQRKASGHAPTFTAEARAKALASRKRNAAARRRRKAARS